MINYIDSRQDQSVCVCVCVWERQRERTLDMIDYYLKSLSHLRHQRKQEREHLRGTETDRVSLTLMSINQCSWGEFSMQRRMMGYMSSGAQPVTKSLRSSTVTLSALVVNQYYIKVHSEKSPAICLRYTFINISFCCQHLLNCVVVWRLCLLPF